MVFHRLENYLRTYRKHSGLTQEEIAFLLGCESGALVSRHEKRQRLPSLETALAYEAIFGVPVAELFAGLRQTIERDIAKRKLKLKSRLQARVVKGSAAQITEYKLRWLHGPERLPAVNQNSSLSLTDQNRRRILALDIHPQSFGFVVFEGTNQILDWGIRSFRTGVNAVKVPAVQKLSALLEEFTPSTIVAKECAMGSDARITEMLTTIEGHAKSRRIPVKFISSGEVNKVFAGSASNKHAVALVLARQFPVLALKLPPKRKLWQSEDYRMSIFDAAALGVAYFAAST